MLGRRGGRGWIGGENGVTLSGMVGWSLCCDDQSTWYFAMWLSIGLTSET